MNKYLALLGSVHLAMSLQRITKRTAPAPGIEKRAKAERFEKGFWQS